MLTWAVVYLWLHAVDANGCGVLMFFAILCDCEMIKYIAKAF